MVVGWPSTNERKSGKDALPSTSPSEAHGKPMVTVVAGPRLCSQNTQSTRTRSGLTRACTYSAVISTVGCALMARTAPPTASIAPSSAQAAADANRARRTAASFFIASVHALHVLERVVGLATVARLPPLRQLDLLARQLLVGNVVQQMRDQIEPRAPLEVARHHEPGRVGCVGRLEHVVAGA